MPEVAICTENVVIPALGPGMLFKGKWLEYPPAYCIQHLSVCFLLLLESLVKTIAVLGKCRAVLSSFSTLS
jgi:hypothetical protein